jgi:hypothetical protein
MRSRSRSRGHSPRRGGASRGATRSPIRWADPGRARAPIAVPSRGKSPRFPSGPEANTGPTGHCSKPLPERMMKRAFRPRALAKVMPAVLPVTINAVAQASASMHMSASTVTDATPLLSGPPAWASIVQAHPTDIDPVTIVARGCDCRILKCQHRCRRASHNRAFRSRSSRVSHWRHARSGCALHESKASKESPSDCCNGHFEMSGPAWHPVARPSLAAAVSFPLM